jgi:hypothetical protein
MAKKKLFLMFEVTGYISASNIVPIRTHVRARNSGDARKICLDRVPELTITSVVPVGE